MRTSSLTSQILDVTGWDLPARVRVENGMIDLDWAPRMDEARALMHALQRFDVLRDELTRVRRHLHHLAAIARNAAHDFRLWPHDASEQHANRSWLHHVAHWKARRRAALGELRLSRRERHGLGAAVDAVGFSAHRRLHGPLTNADRLLVAAVAAHGDTDSAVVEKLFLRAGPLDAGGAPRVDVVVQLARLYVDTRDVISATLRRTVQRGDALRVGRALQTIGVLLPEIAPAAFGLLETYRYPRDVVEHAREAARRVVDSFRLLFLRDMHVAWNEDGPALAASPSLGAALAVDLIRSASSADEHPVCATCGRFFKIDAGVRRPKNGAPLNCVRCRRERKTRARSDHSERLVQRIQTRIERGWSDGQILSDLAQSGALLDGDDFATLLARARARPPRRPHTETR